MNKSTSSLNHTQSTNLQLATYLIIIQILNTSIDMIKAKCVSYEASLKKLIEYVKEQKKKKSVMQRKLKYLQPKMSQG